MSIPGPADRQQNKPPSPGLVTALILLASLGGAAGPGLLLINRHLDRAFIAYRWAHNVAAGQGFSYNVGEAVLSSAASPPYVLLLALGSALLPDLPTLGNLIGVLCITGGALALGNLARQAEHPSTGMLAALLYASFPALWLLLGLETGLWLALCLLAVWLYLRDWTVGAALVLGLATLTRPEGALLAAVLAIDLVVERRRLPPAAAGIYAGIVAVGILWGQAAFSSGGPLPGLGSRAGLPDQIAGSIPAGLAVQGVGLMALSPLWAVMLILALGGAFFARRQAWALILAGWAALHLAVLALVDAPATAWAYAPLIPALTGLAALGGGGLFGLIMRRVPRAPLTALSTGAVLLLIAAPAQSIYRVVTTAPEEASQRWGTLSPTLAAYDDLAAGQWLQENIPSGAVVGSTRLGVLGYAAAGHTLIDYHGELQPDVRHAYERGDAQWWIGEYVPEVVVLRASEYQNLDGYDFSADPWFTGLYSQVMRIEPVRPGGEALLIFRRSAQPPPLSETLINFVTYPGGLTLNRIATDFSLAPLATGQTGRVRLEWLLEGPAEEVRYVAIRVQGQDGVSAAILGRPLDFSAWPRRELLTTYHALPVLAVVPPGAYRVEVGVGPDPFNLTWQPVTEAKVPFSDSAFLGALAGVNAQFGEVALTGYRLARTEEGLEVLLMWKAVSRPQADYQVLIQLRDPAGSVVAQLAVQPHAGSYPTSIWSADEEVPDRYVLDISQVPGGSYEVYVGLIDPDGSRLLTTDGRDTVLVGPVSLNE
ncbi:MAG: hypothetical protein Kow00124_15640 [Anaerolineae bacterium]